MLLNYYRKSLGFGWLCEASQLLVVGWNNINRQQKQMHIMDLGKKLK